jgi:anaerobic magnesium-protoporphyrin IX monomethyl ester cyclase
MDVDYAVVGEAEIGLLKLADGQKPELIDGFIGPSGESVIRGQELENLDILPFPDYALADYKFYSYPSYGKVKFWKTKTLDLVMGRGCAYKCNFCAYNVLSPVRFHSAEYIFNQMEFMRSKYKIDSVFFTDSSIANNRKVLTELCELIVHKKNKNNRMEWYANIRSNQINEDLLNLMWEAGCRFLLYGFESGSQSVLDSMQKGVTIEDNYIAATLHTKYKYLYHASIIAGYPGETEKDIIATANMLREIKPPIIGINCYVPLPGSPDYYRLKAEGKLFTGDPYEWRRIGEVNPSRIYADMPDEKFREMLKILMHIAYTEIPDSIHALWRKEIDYGS